VSNYETRRFHRVSKRTIHRAPIAAIAISVVGLAYSTYAFVSLQAGSNPFFWGSPTVGYVIHEDGDPTITDGTDDTAVRLAFEAWQQVPSSSIAFQEDQGSRARTDWRSDDIHLVIWDETNESGFFGAPSGLVAITPVDFDPSSGLILDADIIFNAKNHDFSTDLASGTFDVQNVATHEVGHFIGLDHSAVVGSTMNPFANQNDTRLRSLELDDLAAAQSIYPLSGTPGAISGRLVRSNGTPISGAHVVAQDMDGNPASAGLSDANGDFLIRGLDQGQYVVYAEPLDGPVRSNNFSLQTSGLTIETDFGTTFFGSASGFAPPQNPTKIFVNFGQTNSLPRTLVARGRLSPAINVTSVSPLTVAPGQAATLTLFGTGLDQVDRLEIPGNDVFVSETQFSAGSVQATLEVSGSALPSVRNIHVYNDLGGDAASVTGGFEIRLPAPLAEGLDPGQAQPGASVQVFGEGFEVGARVHVGAEVTNGFVNADGVSFTAPNIKNGTYTVKVENPDGQVAVLSDALQIVESSSSSSGGGSDGGSSGNTSAGGSSGESGSAAPAAGGGSTGGGALPPPGGGGGGGGGGCSLAGSEGGAPTTPGLALLALLGGLALRRRTA